MNRDNHKIRGLRESYGQGNLLERDLSENPLLQFKKWFDYALDQAVFEANAMTLATCGSDGQPHARTVLLKEIIDEGYIFYTNYESHKGLEIEQNNKVSLLFFWKELERQVRIQGTATKISREHSEQYFHSRPKGSQIGAWASPQSQKITRNELDQQAITIQSKYSDKAQLPLPPFWGGYLVTPTRYEFWQGRKNRLHDRIVYSHIDNSKWEIQRIAP